jgi:hypothetical protein
MALRHPGCGAYVGACALRVRDTEDAVSTRSTNIPIDAAGGGRNWPALSGSSECVRRLAANMRQRGSAGYGITAQRQNKEILTRSGVPSSSSFRAVNGFRP